MNSCSPGVNKTATPAVRPCGTIRLDPVRHSWLLVEPPAQPRSAEPLKKVRTNGPRPSNAVLTHGRTYTSPARLGFYGRYRKMLVYWFNSAKHGLPGIDSGVSLSASGIVYARNDRQWARSARGYV